MSILSTLFGNYGDDLIRNAATKYGDDVLRAGAKTAAKQTILNQADDVAKMTAKQAAKATAKAGKSTPAQQIAKNEFDDYLTSMGATSKLRQQMANEAYNGVLGKTPMAARFQALGTDLANVADKSAAGLNAYGKVMNNLYDYMDNAMVGVDMSGLQKTGSKLFTKAQKTRLAQAGLDVDDVLKSTMSANQANELYRTARDMGLKLSNSTDATQTILGDRLSKFANQIRDKLDETASTVSKSFGLKQQLIDAADSIGDIEVSKALAGMTDDAVTASTVRSEMAPYMKMKDFVGLKAPAEKTLNVLGVDTGVANPLPKLSKAVQKGALKAKDVLQSDGGKTAAIALGAGGLGLLGGLLAGGNGGGNQNIGNMSTLGALTGDSDVVYGGNGMNTQLGGGNAVTGALGGNNDELTLGGYSYDDLENAYVAAIMAGDSGAAGVIADMIGMLDAKTKRQESKKSKSGTAQKQQAAMDILNTLMGNFQAQGPIGGTFTNILNGLTGGNYNYQAANYNEQAQGSLSMIIKALGETGALAEGDVQRAMGLIPQITDSKEKAADKYQKLMVMLQSAGQGD
jgi:hypothetical protein